MLYKNIVLLSSLLFFFACGESTDSSIVKEKNSFSLDAIPIVASLATAEKCENQLAGEVIFVQENEEYHFCASEVKQWVAIDLESVLPSSGIKSLAEDETLKVQIQNDGSLTIESSTGQKAVLSKASEVVAESAVFGTMTSGGAILAPTSDDLPACESDSKGAVYYIESNSEFKYCNGSEYSSIPTGNDAEEQVCKVQDGADQSQSIECAGTSMVIAIKESSNATGETDSGKDNPDEKKDDLTKGPVNHLGVGEPSPDLGKDGDTYVDKFSNQKYEKKEGVWKAIERIYTISASVDSNGRISPNGELKLKFDSLQSFTAKADDGYCFDYWEVDGVKKTEHDGYVMKVIADQSIKAVFTDRCLYTVYVNAAEGLIPSHTGLKLIEKYGKYSLTWELADGYILDKILVNGKEVSSASGHYAFTDVRENYEVEFFTRQYIGGEIEGVSDFSQGSFDGRASSVGGPENGYWFPTTDEDLGGNSYLSVKNPAGDFEKLNIASNLSNAQIGGALSVQSSISSYWNPQEDWPYGYNGWTYAFNVNANLSGGWSLDNAEAAGLTMSDNITIEYKYTSGKALTLLLYEPREMDDAYRPKVRITGSGDWKILQISMTDFIIPDWVTDQSYRPSEVISKIVALQILRFEATTTKGALFDQNTQGGDRMLEIRRLCIGPCPN